MVDRDRPPGWDEVLEEADELATACVSSGTSRRNRSEKKPRFSLRGYHFVELNVMTGNFGEQEGTSGVPPTKASAPIMAELMENIEEEIEDFPPVFALPRKKANASVSELLEDLRSRSDPSVRTPSMLHQHPPHVAIRASGVPLTKASQMLMTERLENIEDETEDLPAKFALPNKKANASVSELLEDLQGRSDPSVRTPSMLHQHASNTAIREQEVSSGVPSTKASQTLMAELLENIEEETEDFPAEFAVPSKETNASVAELLEDLQGRNGTSAGPASSLHQHVRAKDWKSKLPTSGKKTLAILGVRSPDSEDPLEHVIDGTSSDEEEVIQNYLTLANKDVKQQTMSDLFQELFNPTNMEDTMLPMRSTGTGYYGRMQQIMQMEKDRHAEFLRQYNREQGDSKGITAQILSRSLEGKLTVCRCLFEEKSNFTLTCKASTNQAMDESRSTRTIIFSPKICDNVDLLVGNIIDIFPPWKEIKVQEDVILCTYFSHHGAE